MGRQDRAIERIPKKRDRKIIVVCCFSFVVISYVCRSHKHCKDMCRSALCEIRTEWWCKERRKDGNDLVISWLDSVMVSRSLLLLLRLLLCPFCQTEAPAHNIVCDQGSGREEQQILRLINDWNLEITTLSGTQMLCVRHQARLIELWVSADFRKPIWCALCFSRAPSGAAELC